MFAAGYGATWAILTAWGQAQTRRKQAMADALRAAWNGGYARGWTARGRATA